MFLTYDSYFNERGSVPTLYTPPGMDQVASIYSPFIGLVKKFQYHFVEKCATLVENVDMTIKAVPIHSACTTTHSLAYLFLITDKPGQLKIEKCKQLKIPPGPVFAQLKSGHQVEIAGRVVKPEDVLGPTELGKCFTVLECPDESFVDSLAENCGNFQTHLQNKELQFVVHITPKDVFSSAKYQKWLKSFDENVQHFILNSSNQSEMALNDSSRLQVRLNQIDSEMFPLLNENDVNDFQTSKIVPNIPTMLKCNLRPEKCDKIEWSEENCRVNKDEALEDLKNLDNFEQKVQDYRKNVSAVWDLDSFNQNIIFLGTGSSIPGKLRNTSAILLNHRPDSSMLLDCGEATFMQMCRFYGREQIHQALAKISMIFISHLHADHHFGMVRVLEEMSKIYCNKNQNKTVYLLAPQEIYNFLNNFSLPNIKIIFQQTNCLVPARATDEPAVDEPAVDEPAVDELAADEGFNVEKLKEHLGIERIVTVSVPHSYQSHGIIVDLGDGNTIAYSGDSQFSNAFDEQAKNCLLMIHEATMDDELREDADLKRHSTISDAIKVARNCQARFTVLTHFSQRYAKIPLVSGQNDEDLNDYIRNNVGIAFDFMKISLKSLSNIGIIKVPLERLFGEEIQDIHEQQAKRALKRKLITGLV